MELTHFLKNLAGRPSGPNDVLYFNPLISLETFSVIITISLAPGDDLKFWTNRSIHWLMYPSNKYCAISLNLQFQRKILATYHKISNSPCNVNNPKNREQNKQFKSVVNLVHISSQFSTCQKFHSDHVFKALIEQWFTTELTLAITLYTSITGCFLYTVQKLRTLIHLKLNTRVIASKHVKKQRG